MTVWIPLSRLTASHPFLAKGIGTQVAKPQVLTVGLYREAVEGFRY